jgi:1-acyl-sn-glycerol-3-phosphate acyltransferase
LWTGEPVLRGVEHVPRERPLLFVGNHTLYGILDSLFFWWKLYERTGIFLRGLGDRAHFRFPVWRELLSRYGVVEGSPPACARLFEAGHCVLVFPGGAREAAKRKGERYKLLWKQRTGFARMAIEHGVTIVPFVAVGAEHQYSIVFDADDLAASPVGGVVARLGLRDDLLFPVVRGLGPTLLPLPERLYFEILPPITTRELQGAHEDDERCWELRERVRKSVESGIAALIRQRETDPRPTLISRLARRLGASSGE